MSASYVRTKFRQWAQNAATASGINVYDTINFEADPADAVWWTYVFRAEYFEGTFCMPGYIEEGFIRVVFVAQPGTGDSAAITAIEQVVPLLMAEIDPTNRLQIKSYEPIDEMSAGTADSDYRVSVLLNYKHSL